MIITLRLLLPAWWPAARAWSLRKKCCNRTSICERRNNRKSIPLHLKRKDSIQTYYYHSFPATTYSPPISYLPQTNPTSSPYPVLPSAHLHSPAHSDILPHVFPKTKPNVQRALSPRPNSFSYHNIPSRTSHMTPNVISAPPIPTSPNYSQMYRYNNTALCTLINPNLSCNLRNISNAM